MALEDNFFLSNAALNFNFSSLVGNVNEYRNSASTQYGKNNVFCEYIPNELLWILFLSFKFFPMLVVDILNSSKFVFLLSVVVLVEKAEDCLSLTGVSHY